MTHVVIVNQGVLKGGIIGHSRRGHGGHAHLSLITYHYRLHSLHESMSLRGRPSCLPFYRSQPKGALLLKEQEQDPAFARAIPEAVLLQPMQSLHPDTSNRTPAERAGQAEGSQ
jgi:hypothetical protein